MSSLDYSQHPGHHHLKRNCTVRHWLFDNIFVFCSIVIHHVIISRICIIATAICIVIVIATIIICTGGLALDE